MKKQVNKKNHIRIFEHQPLKVGEIYDGTKFTEQHFVKLETFYGEKGVPYFSLIHKGVKLNSFVGVLQVANLTIEVLPKADKTDNSKDKWQNILIGMLRAVGTFDIKAPSSSSLNIKHNSILDLYFELFLKEVEYLFNKGLVKKYRKNDANSLALKGNIIFGKHIQQNLIHQERFYIRHTTYDKIHILHQILFKTIHLLKNINTNITLNSRIGNLLLNFPEMKDILVNDATFNKIILNRKTEDYKNAIEISRMLLLNYHPDISGGQNHVLALMFDMNILWEKFVYVSLRKHLPTEHTITAQITKNFWRPIMGNNSKIKPDIVINKESDDTIVLDTKWKNLENSNPSPDDLRQLYVYHQYFGAKKVALVYPGKEQLKIGKYYKKEGNSISDIECSIITLPPVDNIVKWQKNIADEIMIKWAKHLTIKP